MKLTLTAIFFLLLASASMQARQQDTVFVSDYGIRPYTYETRPEGCVPLLTIAKG